MKEIIEDIILTGLALEGCEFVFGVANYIRNNIACKKEIPYKNLQELETACKKEKRELGIESSSIKLEADKSAYCTKYKNNSYALRFCPETISPFILRHELFHIKRMINNKLKSPNSLIPFKNNYEEWLATSYAIKRSKETNQNETSKK